MRTQDSVTCRVVSQDRELVELAGRWEDLLSASLRPEAMLTPSWLMTWWRHFGTGRTLTVGVYEADGRLVGLAPMCGRDHRYRPGVRFRRLEALGSEDGNGDGVCSDYLHLIVRPGFESAVCDAFVTGMTSGDFGRWDEWVLSAVDGTHPLNTPLRDAWSRAGFPVTETTISSSPYVTLPANWDAYLAGLNKKRRQSLASAQRHFDAWAAGRARFHRAVDEASLHEGRDVLIDLHGQRWRAQGNVGVFNAPRFAAFHDEFMRQQLSSGGLELQWLTVNSRPVAVHYSIRAFGKVNYYQTGRVMEVPTDVRLGIVLVMRAMQDAIGRGDREFDFLAGEAQYKRLFTQTSRPIVQFRVARPGIRETVRRAVRWSADTWRNLGRRQS